MQVKALDWGFFAKLRAPGDVFDIPGPEHLGSWMRVIEVAPQIRPLEKKPRRSMSSKPVGAQPKG